MPSWFGPPNREDDDPTAKSKTLVRNKKGLTCDAHRELAACVKRAEKLLREIDIKVSRGLGKSSKAARIADRIYRQFADLKNELNEALYRDCPEMDAKERLGLYYGPTTDNKVVLLR